MYLRKNLNYLKDPHKEVPKLIENLNIFLDKDGVLRVDGRLAKVARFELEVKYHILTGKRSLLDKFDD